MTLRPHPDVTEKEREVLHRGKVFDLVRLAVTLPSGMELDHVLVEHPGAVAVVARDDQGRILLVRQYRTAANDWTLELPAGRIDPGEDPEATAARELEEETGHRAGHLEPWIQFLAAPGFASEVLHLYRARDLEVIPGGGLAADDDEELEILWMSPRELVDQDQPGDSKTLIAALLCLLEDAGA